MAEWSDTFGPDCSSLSINSFRYNFKTQQLIDWQFCLVPPVSFVLNNDNRPELDGSGWNHPSTSLKLLFSPPYLWYISFYTVFIDQVMNGSR